MKFGTLQQTLNPMTVTWQKKLKLLILKIACILTTHQPIVRFQQNVVRGQTACKERPRDKNCNFLKIQHGGRPPFWKSLNRRISVKKNVRFWWNLVHHCRYRTRWQERDQKLKFLKFNMAAAAMLKIAFLAITHRPIFRFWANFVRGSRTACRQRPHDKNQKLQIFKYQHGRRPPFWKSLNRHFSVKNVRF